MKQQQQRKQITNSMTTPILFSMVGVLCLMVGSIMFVMTATQTVEAMSLTDQMEQQAGGKQPVTLAVIENPDLVARVLQDLLRSIIYSANVEVQSGQNLMAQKRGLDLGISRGFSGSQAGKHLMGLSAASFANGPGRR